MVYLPILILIWWLQGLYFTYLLYNYSSIFITFSFVCCPLWFSLYLIPPGHPFTYTAIISQICRCPLCKKTFQKRPDLQINRTLREITDQFKSMTGGGSVKNKKGGKKGGHKHHNFLAELKTKMPKPLPKDVVDMNGTAQSQGKWAKGFWLICKTRKIYKSNYTWKHKKEMEIWQVKHAV